METKSKLIDMHVHSTCSDGKDSVEEIIAKAISNNVGVLSFTEHYNLGSYQKARKLAENKLEIIPGVEFGTNLECFGMSKKSVCHIGAYYPSYKIIRTFDIFETSRDKCVKKTIKKLQSIGIPITYSIVSKHARKKISIGRFDIAIALCEMGYSKSPIAAYGDYLDHNMPGFVSREKLSPQDLIYEILNAYGVPTLFHPKSLRLNYDNLYDFLEFLKICGLEGLEVYNPRHTEEQTYIFLSMAKKLDLVPTAGSDYHGLPDRNIDIGIGINNNLCVANYELITKLKERQHNISKRIKEARI